MIAFISLKIVFMLANSAYPDEMPPYAAFYLGLHCLPKYLFTATRNERIKMHVQLSTKARLRVFNGIHY